MVRYSHALQKRGGSVSPRPRLTRSLAGIDTRLYWNKRVCGLEKWSTRNVYNGRADCTILALWGTISLLSALTSVALLPVSSCTSFEPPMSSSSIDNMESEVASGVSASHSPSSVLQRGCRLHVPYNMPKNPHSVCPLFLVVSCPRTDVSNCFFCA